MPSTTIGDETSGIDGTPPAAAATAAATATSTTGEVPGDGQTSNRSNPTSQGRKAQIATASSSSSSTTTTTTIEKEKAVQKRRAEVLCDPRIVRIQDALEHAIVTGAGIRRDNGRQNKYWQMYEQRGRRLVKEERRSPQEQQQQGDGNVNQEGRTTTLAAATIVDHSSTTTTTTNKKRTWEQEGPWIHAEDIRIYGSDGSRLSEYKRCRPMKPWPVFKNEWKKTPPLEDDDWNFEHGDSIPPIIFHQARLSQAYPFEEMEMEQGEQNGVVERKGPSHKRNSLVQDAPARMKSLRSTDVTLSEEEIPRALLLRCWERAVHAASNSMFAPVTPYSSHQSSSTSSSSSAAAPATTTTTATATTTTSTRYPCDYNYDNMGKAVMNYNSVHTPLPDKVIHRQCESFGIDIRKQRNKATDLSTMTTICPRCFRTFPTSKELQRHYYGHQQQLGCCRHVIRGRHILLIDDILQGHVHSQTDQLVDVILSSQKGPLGDGLASTLIGEGTVQQPQHHDEVGTTTTTATTANLRNWNDILQILQKTIDSGETSVPSSSSSSSSLSSSTRHPILQTIQTTTTKDPNPLVLNAMVLEVARRRLVDRYANLPR